MELILRSHLYPSCGNPHDARSAGLQHHKKRPSGLVTQWQDNRWTLGGVAGGRWQEVRWGHRKREVGKKLQKMKFFCAQGEGKKSGSEKGDGNLPGDTWGPVKKSRNQQKS